MPNSPTNRRHDNVEMLRDDCNRCRGTFCTYHSALCTFRQRPALIPNRQRNRDAFPSHLCGANSSHAAPPTANTDDASCWSARSSTVHRRWNHIRDRIHRPPGDCYNHDREPNRCYKHRPSGPLGHCPLRHNHRRPPDARAYVRAGSHASQYHCERAQNMCPCTICT